VGIAAAGWTPQFSSPQFQWTHGNDGEVTVMIMAGLGVPYPCFGLTVDQPTTNPSTALEPSVYWIAPGQSAPHRFPVQFTGTVPPGTVLHFTVWVDSLNVDCPDSGVFAFAVTAPF
jgi:hypothetical protein